MSVFDRLARGAALLATVTLLAAAPVQAKVGGGTSSGSRGARTFSPPPSTATAPGAAQPMQRTEMPATAAGRPNVGAPAAPSRFGFGTGMMAGLLGAGLLGALFGHGFFGGLSGLASMFGFLLQVALVVGAAWLLFRFFRRRSDQPAFAGAAGGRPVPAVPPSGATAYARSAPATGSGGPAVNIGPADYAAFEASLKNIQAAYGAEDVAALTHLATPEMVRYLSSDLEANRSKGLRNEVTDATLLQGDLAEAWREGPAEYATVAMRFSLVDVMVDRASGRLVSGDRAKPEVSTELWTFRRENGGPWTLSAIQQTA